MTVPKVMFVPSETRRREGTATRDNTDPNLYDRDECVRQVVKVFPQRDVIWRPGNKVLCVCEDSRCTNQSKECVGWKSGPFTHVFVGAILCLGKWARVTSELP